MYTVTFYSFKGGVGRTMALVNVAAYLLARGRKVLVVDFDLEAPGIGTYDLFEPAAEAAPGIVDYVSSYIQTGSAPDARDYLLEGRPSGGPGKLWLMPAGRQDSSYASRLSAIDWRLLYRDQQGYLLFEDLKAQWQQVLQPDYVLIDSRTGHTDVGGICTRQLPDAVVALFIPNEQNLLGLQKVVSGIRRETEAPRRKSIYIHFVPSNIPELDDEDGIIQNSLERAQERLEYGEPATIIHRYGSLSLLNQSIFVRDRPKTRLARELAELATTISRENPRDREGALAYLHRVKARSSPWARIGDPRDSLEDRLGAIASIHSKDGEVLAHLADIRESHGEWAEALDLLTTAIEAGYRTSDILSQRARLHRILAHSQEAIADFQAALELETASPSSIFIAVRSLSTLKPEVLERVDWTSRLKSLPPQEAIEIISGLAFSSSLLPRLEHVLRELWYSAGSGRGGEVARPQLILVLIGQKKFREAMEIIAPERSSLLVSDNINDVFNYAMAEWAETGTVPLDLFQRVCILGGEVSSDRGANYAQCLAVACCFVRGAEEAARWVDRARSAITSNPLRTFSCWRYLEVLPGEFAEDLHALERMISGENVRPLFMMSS